MINARIHTERVESKYAHLMPAIIARIYDTIEGLLIRIQSHIKMDKLSGQVLKRRSGLLSSTIHYAREKVMNGVRARMFAGTEYAKPHEYGGIYNIPAHQRTSKLGNTFTVRAHTATYPERSFLRSGVSDYREAYREVIRGSIRAVA